MSGWHEESVLRKNILNRFIECCGEIVLIAKLLLYDTQNLTEKLFEVDAIARGCGRRWVGWGRCILRLRTSLLAPRCGGLRRKFVEEINGFATVSGDLRVLSLALLQYFPFFGIDALQWLPLFRQRVEFLERFQEALDFLLLKSPRPSDLLRHFLYLRDVAIHV